MEKDKYAILEKNLNSLEWRITDDIRLLIRKLNSEWQKVEKYKEAIVISKEERESFKRQILQINEDKINLIKQLKGSEDRRDSVQKSHEELKKYFSGLRKEEEKVGKAYDKETEVLRRKIELNERKWQERYELRYAKKPFVQEHEKAKRSLAESKKQLQCSKSNLRECQADIFKAKCERGRRNAEESGFYPLHSFIVRISRVGVGIGKLEAEEDETLKEVSYLQHTLDNVLEIRASEEKLDACEKENIDDDELMTQHTEIFNGNHDHFQNTNAQLRHGLVHESQLPNHRSQLQHELNYPAPLKATALQSRTAAQNSTTLSELKVRNRMERLILYTPKFSPSPDENPQPTMNFNPSKSTSIAARPIDSKQFSRLREKRFTEISVNNSSRSSTTAKQFSEISKLSDNARNNVAVNRKDELQMQNTKEFGAVTKSFCKATKRSVTTAHESSEDTLSLRQGVPPLISVQKDSMKMNKNSTLPCKSRVLHDEVSRTTRYNNVQNNETEMSEKCIEKNISIENTERSYPRAPYTYIANVKSYPHHAKENSAMERGVVNSDAKRMCVDTGYAAERGSYQNDQKTKKVRIVDDDQDASISGHDFTVSNWNIGHGTVRMRADMPNTGFSESSNQNRYLTPNEMLHKNQVLRVKSAVDRIDDSNGKVHTKVTLENIEKEPQKTLLNVPDGILTTSTDQVLRAKSAENRIHDSNDKVHPKMTLKNIEKEPQKTLRNVSDGLLTTSTDQIHQRSKENTLDKYHQELNIPHEKCRSINRTHQEAMLEKMGNTQRKFLTVDAICSDPSLNATAIKVYEDTIIDKFISKVRNMDHRMSKASEPPREDNVSYKTNADAFNQELSDVSAGKDYKDQRDINRAKHKNLCKVDQEVLSVQKESLRAHNVSGDSFSMNVDEVYETSVDIDVDEAFTVDEIHMDKSHCNSESLENFHSEALSTYVRNSQKEPTKVGACDVSAKMKTDTVFQEQNATSISKETRNTVIDKEDDESVHINVDTDRQETEFTRADSFKSKSLVMNRSKVHSQPSIRAEGFRAIQSMEVDTLSLGGHDTSQGEIQEQPIRDDNLPQQFENLNCNSDPQEIQRKQLIEEMRIQKCEVITSDNNNSTALELKNEKTITTASSNSFKTGETALCVSDASVSPAVEKEIEAEPPQERNSMVSETKPCQLLTQDLTQESNTNKSVICEKEKPNSSANESPVQSTLNTSQNNNFKSSSSGERYFSAHSSGEFTQDKMSANDTCQLQASVLKDYGVDIKTQSPFDFEKHMEVLGKIKESPQFTYRTRPMYKPSAMSKAPPEMAEVAVKDISFDSVSFLNNPSVSDDNLRDSEKPGLQESEFLSFAFEDYLADSPNSEEGVKEKAMFSFGCDSPKSSVQSPPFFPMFAAAVDTQENDPGHAKSDFVFSFGGAEKTKSPEEPSVFKFAF